MKKDLSIVAVTVAFIVGFMLGVIAAEAHSSKVWWIVDILKQPAPIDGTSLVWKNNFVLHDKDGRDYEFGLRADGVVIWREIKK